MKSRKKILFASILVALSSYSIKSVAEAEKFKLRNPSLQQLKNKKVQITPDLVFELGDYVKQTNFKIRPEFKRLFTPQFQQQFLKRPAKYTETVESFGDRLQVVRILKLDTKDACARGLSGKRVSLCFRPSRGQMTAGVKADVVKIRQKIKARLAKSKASKRPDLIKLVKMTDKQLLDYVLNKQTSEKIIKHTSVVPFVAYKMNKVPQIDLFKANVRLPKTNAIKTLAQPMSFNRAVFATKSPPLKHMTSPVMRLPKKERLEILKPADLVAQNGPFRFKTNHNKKIKTIFGATYGRSYGDQFEVQFAGSTWLTDRYYASFTYNIEAGIGLRFPFELDVSATIDKVYSSKANRIVNYPAKSLCRGVTQAKNANLCAQRATVKIKARALDANTAFYRDAKIAPNQLFRGKEFVLTIGARCKLYASIPGPNISKRCPSALRGLDFSKDFKPQLGGNRPLNILEYTLSGRPLGLSIDSGVGYAAINPGAALQAVSGKIKLTVEGTKAKTSSKKLSFDTRSQRFTVTEDVNRGQGAWGIQLKKPKYKVGVRVVPRLEVEVGVDLGVYEWVRTFGPYDVDAVAINLGSFTFDRHKGTASSWNLPIDTRLEQ